jgi:hypothetical protein
MWDKAESPSLGAAARHLRPLHVYPRPVRNINIFYDVALKCRIGDHRRGHCFAFYVRRLCDQFLFEFTEAFFARGTTQGWEYPWWFRAAFRSIVGWQGPPCVVFRVSHRSPSLFVIVRHNSRERSVRRKVSLHNASRLWRNKSRRGKSGETGYRRDIVISRWYIDKLRDVSGNFHKLAALARSLKVVARTRCRDKYVTSDLSGILRKGESPFSRAHWSSGARIDGNGGAWIWEGGEPLRWKLGSSKGDPLRDDSEEKTSGLDK